MEEIIACLQLDASYVHVQSSLSQWKQTSFCAENGIAHVSTRTQAKSFHSLSEHQTAVPMQTTEHQWKHHSPQPSKVYCIAEFQDALNLNQITQHPAFIDSIDLQRTL